MGGRKEAAKAHFSSMLFDNMLPWLLSLSLMFNVLDNSILSSTAIDIKKEHQTKAISENKLSPEPAKRVNSKMVFPHSITNKVGTKLLL